MGEKKHPIIGVMTGSFVSDYPRTILTELYERLKGTDVQLRLYAGLDTNIIFDRNLTDDDGTKPHRTYDEGFDRHWLSLFEYSRFEDIDLLVITYGNIMASHPTIEPGAFLSTLPDVPVILLGTDLEVANGAYVVVDNYGEMKRCVSHLIDEHGCQNIGFISGPKESASANLRMEAYLDALEEHGLPIRDELIVYGDYLNNVDSLVEELFAQNPAMDAIVSSNDEMCNAVYRVAEAHRRVIGKDLAVTGFDDADFARYMEPPLTTVRQDYGNLVDAAVELIHDFLSGRPLKNRHIPATFVRRASCGCPEKDAQSDKTEQYIRYEEVYRTQLENLLSAVSLRNLLLETASRKAFFETLATELADSGAESSYVFLTEKPIRIREGEDFVLPDTMQLYMAQEGADCKGYDMDNAPIIHRKELSTVVNDNNNRLFASFLLFYRDYQYGTLLVGTNPRNIRHFYSMSIQIGSGLRYLTLALRQQKMNRILKEQNQILDFAAYHDELTGLYNRAGIMKKMLDFLHGHKDTPVFVAVMADLDHLKQINDTFGHDAGDSAIRMVSKVLTDVLPEGSPVGRSGGDEFTSMFIPAYDSQLEDIAKQVKDACEAYNAVSGKPYYLGISVGCAPFDNAESVDLSAELKRADNALYEAKKLRRANVVRDSL